VLQIARLGLLGLALSCSVCVAQERCTALQGTSVSGARIESAVHKGADAALGLPTHCELKVIASSGPGSRITMVYRLPDDWNGRMLGLGTGGWAGNTLAVPLRSSQTTAIVGLPRGYATAQTDAGHLEPPLLTSAAVSDVQWVRDNPVAVKDFAYLAIHEMTVLGKQVVARYYGRPATKNYFYGCSTGGRQGMMETQRYPDDYDGVVAGAPVYSLMVQTSAVVRSRYFQAPEAAIDEALLARVKAAVMGACDSLDGLIDGVITDPRRCEWDPRAMACDAGSPEGSCLAPAQLTALRQAYTTVRTRSGLVGSYGLARGSELVWNPGVLTTAGERNARNGALGDLVPLMFRDPAFDPMQFDMEEHQAAVHQTPFAKDYEATSTDLSRFLARGGKLILWHGLNDMGPSPHSTQDYYERAVAKNGGRNLRYYAAPGVNHCSEGDGADRFDLLTTLENWVEKGVAPEQSPIIARNPRRDFERPLCAWPKLPAYVGGDPARASSFSCR
jgi:feruloyl esterase